MQTFVVLIRIPGDTPPFSTTKKKQLARRISDRINRNLETLDSVKNYSKKSAKQGSGKGERADAISVVVNDQSVPSQQQQTRGGNTALFNKYKLSVTFPTVGSSQRDRANCKAVLACALKSWAQETKRVIPQEQWARSGLYSIEKGPSSQQANHSEMRQKYARVLREAIGTLGPKSALRAPLTKELDSLDSTKQFLDKWVGQIRELIEWLGSSRSLQIGGYEIGVLPPHQKAAGQMPLPQTLSKEQAAVVGLFAIAHQRSSGAQGQQQRVRRVSNYPITEWSNIAFELASALYNKPGCLRGTFSPPPPAKMRDALQKFCAESLRLAADEQTNDRFRTLLQILHLLILEGDLGDITSIPPVTKKLKLDAAPAMQWRKNAGLVGWFRVQLKAIIENSDAKPMPNELWKRGGDPCAERRRGPIGIDNVVEFQNQIMTVNNAVSTVYPYDVDVCSAGLPDQISFTKYDLRLQPPCPDLVDCRMVGIMRGSTTLPDEYWNENNAASVPHTYLPTVSTLKFPIIISTLNGRGNSFVGIGGSKFHPYQQREFEELLLEMCNSGNLPSQMQLNNNAYYVVDLDSYKMQLAQFLIRTSMTRAPDNMLTKCPGYVVKEGSAPRYMVVVRSVRGRPSEYHCVKNDADLLSKVIDNVANVESIYRLQRPRRSSSGGGRRIPTLQQLEVLVRGGKTFVGRGPVVLASDQ